MELPITNFNQAKALKELGFPQENDSWNYYDIEGKCVPYLQKGGHKEFCCDAPSLALVAYWLIKVKNIHVVANPSVYKDGNTYHYVIVQPGKTPIGKHGFKTSEEALSAGIDRILENLNKQ